ELITLAGIGEPAAQAGVAVHIFRANRSMGERYFVDSDGELMFVPQLGEILIFTELGRLRVAPGEIGVVPRGIKFKVELLEKQARGYLCENYGAPFRLPELGLIGAQGLAQACDFLAPVAAIEDQDAKCEVIKKFMKGPWAAEWSRSQLEVAAWPGYYAPYKYDLTRCMTI